MNHQGSSRMIPGGPILFVLLTLLTSAATAQRPQLSVQSQVNAFLAPDTPVPFGEFPDAAGEPMTLLQEGRYLLWLADGGLALQKGAEVPPPAQFAALTEVYFNETNLIPRFNLEPAYLVFYRGSYESMPDEAERTRASERFGGHTVLFDDDDTIPALWEEEGRGGLSPTGLYLIEDGVVRYRCLDAWRWEANHLVELIVQGARAFLEGREPEAFPAPLRVARAAIPEGVPVQGEALLILRVTGLAAEAPEEGAVIEREEGLDGAFRASIAWSHPGAQSRFLLGALTPLLLIYGVQGVGLVYEAAERVPELEAAFPDWRFVPQDGPEAQLRWLELLSRRRSWTVKGGYSSP